MKDMTKLKEEDDTKYLEIMKIICDYLIERGIEHTVSNDFFLTIDRTSMVQYVNKTERVWEGDCYTRVLDEIKPLVENHVKYIYWSSRTDDWYGLDWIVK